MKKMILATAVAVALAGIIGCTEDFDAKRTVSVNGKVFGETRDYGYEAGAKLYDTNTGKVVGFIGIDDVVYSETMYSSEKDCGGVFVGFCEYEAEDRCNVPNYERMVDHLISAYIYIPCGKKIQNGGN